MIKKDELVRLQDGEYFVLDVIKYGTKTYAFANKIGDNDTILNVYKIIYEEDSNIIVLEEEKILNDLLPIFEERIMEELNKAKREK